MPRPVLITINALVVRSPLKRKRGRSLWSCPGKENRAIAARRLWVWVRVAIVFEACDRAIALCKVYSKIDLGKLSQKEVRTWKK